MMVWTIVNTGDPIPDHRLICTITDQHRFKIEWISTLVDSMHSDTQY